MTSVSSPDEDPPLGSGGSPSGAVHVLSPQAAGLRRGVPLAGSVHRLSQRHLAAAGEIEFVNGKAETSGVHG